MHLLSIADNKKKMTLKQKDYKNHELSDDREKELRKSKVLHQGVTRI